jgi:hypothetical protein
MLPSCTMVESWATAMADSNSHAFAGGLRCSILQLGRKYMDCDKELPLVSQPPLKSNVSCHSSFGSSNSELRKGDLVVRNVCSRGCHSQSMIMTMIDILSGGYSMDFDALGRPSSISDETIDNIPYSFMLKMATI